jgi:hypothetical protein
MAEDNSKKPWVSNYPPLREWLDKVNATCIEQHPIGPLSKPIAYLERWLVRGRVIIVEVRSDLNGWNIYTAAETNKISDTLLDAEVRLGMRKG